jgi:hypothetical protein
MAQASDDVGFSTWFLALSPGSQKQRTYFSSVDALTCTLKHRQLRALHIGQQEFNSIQANG